MTGPELLADLAARGVRLAAYGERLTFDAPAGAMTPELLELLKTHKPELLVILAGEPEQKPPAGGRPETRADKEIRRFLRVAVPRPDKRGLYDPDSLRDKSGRTYWAYNLNHG